MALLGVCVFWLSGGAARSLVGGNLKESLSGTGVAATAPNLPQRSGAGSAAGAAKVAL